MTDDGMNVLNSGSSKCQSCWTNSWFCNCQYASAFVCKKKMNNNFRSSFHFEFKWDSYYRLLSICPSRIQLHNTLFFVVLQLRTKMCTQWFSNCGHKSMLHPCVLPYMHGSMQRTQRREREKWRWLHCRVDILARNTRAYSLIQQVTTTQMRIWLFFFSQSSPFISIISSFHLVCISNRFSFQNTERTQTLNCQSNKKPIHVCLIYNLVSMSLPYHSNESIEYPYVRTMSFATTCLYMFFCMNAIDIRMLHSWNSPACCF